MMNRLFLLLILSLSQISCSVISSYHEQEDIGVESDGKSVVYYLPRGVLTATLYVVPNDLVFSLDISDPTFVPDRRQRYRLSYNPLPNHDDNLIVDLSPNGFLKKITSTDQDQTAEIIAEAVKAATYFSIGGESFVAPNGSISLASLTFDPADPVALQDLNLALNRKASQFLEKSKPLACRTDPKADTCKLYREAELEVNGGQLIKIGLVTAEMVSNKDEADFYKGASLDASTRKCDSGICYRPFEPLLLTYQIGDNLQTRVIQLPNLQEPVALDIERAFLVQKVYTIEFNEDNGALKQYSVKKPSELLAAVKLPLAVVAAFGEAFQFRASILQKQKGSIDAEKQLLDSQRQLNQLRAQQESQPGRRSVATQNYYRTDLRPQSGTQLGADGTPVTEGGADRNTPGGLVITK